MSQTVLDFLAHFTLVRRVLLFMANRAVRFDDAVTEAFCRDEEKSDLRRARKATG